MATLTIESGRLSGRVLAQPSKSMAHRALICALLAKGESLIDNVVLSQDIEATLGAARALGAHAEVFPSDRFQGRKQVKVVSEGLVRLMEDTLDCHESGSTARFIMPLTRLSEAPVTFTGRGKLVSRPFEVYKSLFIEKGIRYEDEEGNMPIRLSGRLMPGDYELAGDISSQFISGLLFALPLLEGNSRILVNGRLESLPYIQMTLSAMQDFGVSVEVAQDFMTFTIKGNQSYKATNAVVEGDWSQAAFFCVLGAISGDIRIDGLNSQSLQGDRVIVDMIRSMGAKVTEDGGSLCIASGPLKAITADVSQCPDLVPALAVALCLCKGQSAIINAARLRIKESDRLKAVADVMNRLGGRVSELPEGLVIHGVEKYTGNSVQGWNDHRIVMACAIASSVCDSPVVLEGFEAVAKSYPDFWQDFMSLGGKIA